MRGTEMPPPRNPVGYTYAELAGIINCDADEVREFMFFQTVGIDPDTGAELVYPWDARAAARKLAPRRLETAAAAAAADFMDEYADVFEELGGRD